MIKYWTSFEYTPQIQKSFDYKNYDNNIYTFDIETTNYIIYKGQIYQSDYYDTLPHTEQVKCEKQSTMYVWQLGINEQVYYGRTWEELKQFLHIINNLNNKKKILFIHNAAFEFQFLSNAFDFCNIFARKTRKIMKCEFSDYNIEIRCTYVLTNLSLEQIAKNYPLGVEKKTGELDYTLLRHSSTQLTSEELEYCEYDCLVMYEYIRQIELTKYEKVNKIPLTQTGHVRGELRSKVISNAAYRRKTKKAIDKDPIIYNKLVQSYWGGYTHANWLHADYILKDVDSYDLTSDYPSIICFEKFPMTKFQSCIITDSKQLIDCFAYIIHVRLTNIECKYYNTFISSSKCQQYQVHKKSDIDNGRIIRADYIEITCTDVDFLFLIKAYDIEKIEYLDCYYSSYDYLPIEIVDFTLDKYENKTKYKDVKGKEVIYQNEKSNFNSIYGMMCTNTIRDEVVFEENKQTWEDERKLTNIEIVERLNKLEKQSFLSFAWGVWVTAYARRNILELCIANDSKCAYIDTDSLKLIKGYDKKPIEEFNKKVIEKIDNIVKKRGIDYKRFVPKNDKGEECMLGILKFEGTYKEFITQGAKKYAYRDTENELHITVSGVPKCGVVSLENDISNFKDNLIFKYCDTNKLTVLYSDEMEKVELKDYLGNTQIVSEKKGCILLPATYSLNKSGEYAGLLSDESSLRSIYNETI
ncbi:MAG: hypothetical protein NC548_33590 [Lachnospiraceae bacterium]|nr:hypothetical protein [Lachnospiraceae bacterium]MCM1232728.1 hypothetical protein [Ruminococcus flavefaciens]